MRKISEHFLRSEFQCKCGCGYDTADSELVLMLESIRAHFGQPITITSACRCPSHNERVGGSANSQHLYGRAADIVIRDHTVEQMYKLADSVNLFRFGGIGVYPDDRFIHVDVRTHRARWARMGGTYRPFEDWERTIRGTGPSRNQPQGLQEE